MPRTFKDLVKYNNDPSQKPNSSIHFLAQTENPNVLPPRPFLQTPAVGTLTVTQYYALLDYAQTLFEQDLSAWVQVLHHLIMTHAWDKTLSLLPRHTTDLLKLDPPPAFTDDIQAYRARLQALLSNDQDFKLVLNDDGSVTIGITFRNEVVPFHLSIIENGNEQELKAQELNVIAFLTLDKIEKTDIIRTNYSKSTSRQYLIHWDTNLIDILKSKNPDAPLACYDLYTVTQELLDDVHQLNQMPDEPTTPANQKAFAKWLIYLHGFLHGAFHKQDAKSFHVTCSHVTKELDSKGYSGITASLNRGPDFNLVYNEGNSVDLTTSVYAPNHPVYGNWYLNAPPSTNIHELRQLRVHWPKEMLQQFRDEHWPTHLLQAFEEGK